MSQHFDLFVDGASSAAASGATAALIDPSTGQRFGTVANAGVEDVDRAVRAARRSFDEGAWRGQRSADRAGVLRTVAKALRDRADEFAQLECQDAGATITKARGADVGGAAHWFRTMAELASTLDAEHALPQTLAPGPSYNYVQREPVGVAGAIIPWNFPLQMAAWKMSAALAAGCSIVLKPALEAPTTSVLLAEVLRDAGVPDGVVNVVPGGAEAGQALVDHDLVDKISFTGSVTVGQEVMRRAAGTLKNLTLELGGKSAQVVLDGADEDLAVDGALYSIFFHSGQVCTAGSRLLVPDALHDRFVERLIERAESAITLGPADDPSTTMGPLVSAAHRDRVLSYVERGLADGATLALGGHALDGDGFFVEPTIFTDVRPDHAIAQEEIFGPVLSVLRYSDVDEAVAIANGTTFGLAAGVWGPPAAAMKTAARLRAGTVWVNDYHLLNPKYPFGGYGRSGLGREHGLEGLLAYTESKHVHVAIDQDRRSKRWFDMTVRGR